MIASLGDLVVLAIACGGAVVLMLLTWPGRR